MNKLFTKIATAFVGIAMAVGVGVAVGNNNNFVKAEALDGKATFAIADYVTAHGWEANVKYSSFDLDTHINISASTSGNNGKYISSGPDWRLYQSDKGTVTITATNATLVSAKFTYNVSNNGVLCVGETTYSSNATISLSGTSKTFSVGSTAEGTTNAQVRIKAIEVNYTYESGGQAATSLNVENISGLYPGRTASAVVTTNPNGAEMPASLTYVSGNESVFTVSNAGLVTAVGGGSAQLTVKSSSDDSVFGTATVSVTSFPSVDSRITINNENPYIIYATDGSDNDNRYSLTGITNNIGTVEVENDGVLNASYRFTVVPGAYPNTVAFRLSQNNFIGLTNNNNNLHLVTVNNDKPNENSSWVITDSNVILARTYGNNSTCRAIKLNHNSGNPRFACYQGTSYGNTYYAPSFYEILPEGLTGISASNISGLYPGQTAQLSVQPVPQAASLEGATYSYVSGTTAVATVDENGKVTAVAAGSSTITITATVNAKNYQTTCTVSVSNYPAATGVTVGSYYAIQSVMDETTYELTGIASNYGSVTSSAVATSDKYLLKAVAGAYTNTISFMNDNGYVKYTGSGANIVFEQSKSANSSWVVDKTNDDYTISLAATYGLASQRKLLLNKNSGNPRISCYTNNPDDSTYFRVSLVQVTNNLTDFTLDESSKTIFVGAEVRLGVTYTPANATDKNVAWTSSDPTVASVDNGVVTALKAGTTTITASQTIGGNNVSRTCALTVKSNVAAHAGTPADPYTVEEAVYIAKGIIEKGPGNVDVKKTAATVKGIITNVVTANSSTLTFWIGDNASQVDASTDGFEIYRAATVMNKSIAARYPNAEAAALDFTNGYTVKVTGDITLYGNTSEFSEGSDVIFNNHTEAADYARAFNTSISATCDDEYGNTDLSALKNKWDTQKDNYDDLDELSQDILESAIKNESGDDIAKFAAKYDYIVGKYLKGKGDSRFVDFIGRNPAAITSGMIMNMPQVGGSSATTTVILIAVVSTFAVGAFFLLKKKKTK